jgi:hypothetical protein
MVEQSKRFSYLARALIPPQPGELEKKELHEQAGRAIVELSSVENLLALIFCILSIPVGIELSKEMFASQGAFEKKLKLVDFIVKRANYPHEEALWVEIYKELNNHRGVRNLIAHQRMMLNYNPETPEVEASLMPLFYKSGGKGLRTDEIRSTADELENLNKRLWEFVKLLDSPR